MVFASWRRAARRPSCPFALPARLRASACSDDAEAVAVPLGDGDGGVQVLRDDGAPQKAADHPGVPAVVPDQLGGHPPVAGAAFQTLLRQQPPLHRRQGQEGAPSRLGVHQDADGPLGHPLVLHHNVLHGGPQGNLQGGGVFLFHLDKLRNRAHHSPEGACGGVLHHRLDTVLEPLQIPLHIA